jgi:hypothetical protein
MQKLGISVRIVKRVAASLQSAIPRSRETL